MNAFLATWKGHGSDWIRAKFWNWKSLCSCCLSLSEPISRDKDCLFSFSFFFFFWKREKGERGRKRGGKVWCIDVWEKHQLVASHMPPTRDLAHNRGTCPDWELNSWPLVCGVTPNPLSRTSQGRGLTLYGDFIQKLEIGEDDGLCTLKNCLNISSQANIFIRRRKGR